MVSSENSSFFFITHIEKKSEKGSIAEQALEKGEHRVKVLTQLQLGATRQYQNQKQKQIIY